MSDVQLEMLACKEIQILINKINEQTLNEELANDLLLRDESSPTLSKNSIKCNDYLLLSKLRNMKMLEKKRRKRYKKEYLSKIYQIYEEFPDSQNVIRKALKVPRTTFRRIIERIYKLGPSEVKTNPQYQTKSVLAPEQQILIRNFIRPPTNPTTIDRI